MNLLPWVNRLNPNKIAVMMKLNFIGPFHFVLFFPFYFADIDQSA